MAPDAAGYLTTPGAPGLADFGGRYVGGYPLFFPRFVKTTTTEAAPVFAVFEGRGFRVRRSVTGPVLVNDPVAAEMQGRELPLDDSSVAQSVGSRARREVKRLSVRQPKFPLVENRDEWGSHSYYGVGENRKEWASLPFFLPASVASVPPW
jgi:hypothetical protein